MNQDQQENNSWELPPDFLDSKTYLNHSIPTYELPENTIKFFNFQTSVPAETPLEKSEQEKAIQDQIKLGILRVNNVPTQTNDNSYHPELQLSSSPAKITVLNGQLIATQQAPPKQEYNILKDFSNKVALPSKPTSLFGNNKKVGRNDSCPCGSGRKYKVCHGR